MDNLYLIISIGVLAVVIYIVAKVLMKPIKLLWKLLVNSAIGLFLLILFNYLGTYIDINIPINIITVLVAGFLGIPGIILLIGFQYLL